MVTLLLVHQFELWQAFNADITQYADDDSDDTIFLLLRHVSVHTHAQRGGGRGAATLPSHLRRGDTKSAHTLT